MQYNTVYGCFCLCVLCRNVDGSQQLKSRLPRWQCEISMIQSVLQSRSLPRTSLLLAIAWPTLRTWRWRHYVRLKRLCCAIPVAFWLPLSLWIFGWREYQAIRMDFGPSVCSCLVTNLWEPRLPANGRFSPASIMLRASKVSGRTYAPGRVLKSNEGLVI
jgi:hypothetical protein